MQEAPTRWRLTSLILHCHHVEVLCGSRQQGPVFRGHGGPRAQKGLQGWPRTTEAGLPRPPWPRPARGGSRAPTGARLQGARLPGRGKPGLQGPGAAILQAWEEEIVQPGLHLLPSLAEDLVPACPGTLQRSYLPACQHLRVSGPGGQRGQMSVVLSPLPLPGLVSGSLLFLFLFFLLQISSSLSCATVFNCALGPFRQGLCHRVLSPEA